MSPWALDQSSVPGNEVYRRPLGTLELCYYWDSVFVGTGDSVRHLQVEVKNGRGHEIFGRENATRAWLATKQQYPLLGCRVEESEGGERVDFVVEERKLRELHSDELTITEISSPQEVDDLVESLLNEPRQLPTDRVARFWILPRSDRPDYYHLVFLTAHLIMDGPGNATITRTFFNTLCTPGGPPVTELNSRLHMVLPMEDRHPIQSLSIPQKRWRRAIASVLNDLRRPKQGGHSLPRVFTSSTPYTPAVSRRILLTFHEDLAPRIIANCRKAKITIAHALPVLAQLAHARVLHRLYGQKIISEQEWAKRKQQPMHFDGPLNLRPFLDRDWYEAGGASEVFVATGFYSYTLPYMPTSEAGMDHWEDGAPPFSALLSKERFILRSHNIKKQATALMKHPLFYEFNALRTQGLSRHNKLVGLRWRGTQSGDNVPVTEEDPSNTAPISANGGSSIGNVSDILPSDYPLSPEATSSETVHEPMMRMTGSAIYLRCRPDDFYLGSSMWNGQMDLFVLWDGNVREDKLVREWLGEVGKAAEWYLGGEGGSQTVGKSRL